MRVRLQFKSKPNSYTDPRCKCGGQMTGKSVFLPEEVSRTSSPRGRRSKACREKSAEVIVPPRWSAGRTETYGGDATATETVTSKSRKSPRRRRPESIDGIARIR